MKFLILLFTLAAVTFAGAQTNSTGAEKLKTATAIHAVCMSILPALHESVTTNAATKKHPASLSVDWQTFAGKLANADTSTCPPDFQAAWTRYVTAAFKMSTLPKADMKDLTMILGAFSLHPAAIAGVVGTAQGRANSADALANELKEAGLNCKLIAAQYGVRFGGN